MLTQEERDLVEEAVIGVIKLQQNPRQVVVAGLPADLQGLFADGPPVVLARSAIELCLKDAYLREPPALVGLLVTLLPGRPEITQIVNRIRTPPPPVASPFDAVVLDTKLPFLDRTPVRTFLRALTQPSPAQPIVVITGAPKFGKSYTAEFIDHLCRHLPGVQQCLVEILPGEGASTGPQELASDIVARIGGDARTPPPANTNLERWMQDLSNWIISEATKSQLQWWIVLDGFNNGELRHDTRLLIVKLSKTITTGLAQRLHRLILIDFDRTILTLQPGRIAAETTRGIPGSAVQTFIADVVAAAQVQVNVNAITTKVLEGLADPIMDLPELAQRLNNVLAVVEERQP